MIGKLEPARGTVVKRLRSYGFQTASDGSAAIIARTTPSPRGVHGIPARTVKCLYTFRTCTQQYSGPCAAEPADGAEIKT